VIPQCDARRWVPRATNGRARINPLYYRLIDEFGKITGVSRDYEHQLLTFGRSDRSYADRCDSDFFLFRHGRTGHRDFLVEK